MDEGQMDIQSIQFVEGVKGPLARKNLIWIYIKYETK